MRNQNPRVLFATSEVYPLVKTGGLGDVSSALPRALLDLGVDIQILVPGYPQVLDSSRDLKVISELQPLPDRHTVQLLQGRLPNSGPPLLILDAPQLYKREGGPYQDQNGKEWSDNARRFGTLSQVAAILSSSQSPIKWQPDILHCNDWQTGLSPAYLLNSTGPRARTVISIHNLGFTGAFSSSWVSKLGLPQDGFCMDGFEFYGQLSFLKAGLHYADHITTVSNTYAQEIQSEEYGGGFHELLAGRREHLSGILNGIDLSEWDPTKDKHLKQTYGIDSLNEKSVNKRQLQTRFNLPCKPDVPLFCIVSRLTSQKGIKLIPDALRLLRHRPWQLVILGTGEVELEKQLSELAKEVPDRVSITIAYDEALAHQIEGGADIFVMPSQYEPCGLNQIYSMRYGTPPLVRRTGGLADTVVDATPEALLNRSATGFVFEDFDSQALSSCMERALDLYAEPETWRLIQCNGMISNFGWERSAGKYLSLYKKLLTELQLSTGCQPT